MTRRNTSYHVPERFLRQLWKHQHFATSHLRTTDQRPVEIVSPGVLNRDGGPDFVDASIRIGGILYRGNVELHQHVEEWVEHGHNKDPKYTSVILHVVFHKTTTVLPTTKNKRVIPVLVIEDYLTSSYRTTWNSMILDERAERLKTIRCYSLNDRVDSSLIRAWLEKLAIERIELKVRRFEERLKEMVDESRITVKEPPPKYDEIPFGLNPEELPSPMQRYPLSEFRKSQLWDQLLYEGMMEALGYSKNQDPFLRLAKSIRLQFIARMLESRRLTDEEYILQIEALLFGAADMIPPVRGMKDDESKKRIHQLSAIWKDLRQYYRAEILNSTDWQFFRLRPENFPTVRIAGAARLITRLLRKNFLKSIIQTVKNGEQGSHEKFVLLEHTFTTHADEFWTSHYRFGEPAKHYLKTLVGKNRADEIVLNAVIPVCLLYARIFKDKDVRQSTLRIFEECPALSENSVTTTISDQLVKGKLKLDSAMLQQGVLQLYKFYCVEERCTECAVGKKVFSV
ncbi:MAG: DUF2851 family protein [Ignavibacteria bacterium]|nr:DUF2851 family protein [Ignavibacteria bacterium]MBI3765494.1 DUF2851 family protein [Ignavibacteriales bacterium]